MRRLFAFALSILVLIYMQPIAAQAKESIGETVYFEDGSSLTVYVEQVNSRASGTKTASKTYQYTDSDGDIAWKAVLTGTFIYTGSSAQCTASSVDVTIYNTGWYVVSKTAGKSGASATGNVTMGLKKLGITVKKMPLTMTLTCDVNGNLS